MWPGQVAMDIGVHCWRSNMAGEADTERGPRELFRLSLGLAATSGSLRSLTGETIHIALDSDGRAYFGGANSSGH
jgi:hypothetical protein